VTERPGQLSLFGEEPAEPAPTPTLDLAPVYADAAVIKAQLPAGVHFGTSSWSFPGWRGLVYSREASTTALAREGLREYSKHPLLTTVGVDRSYYAPVPDDDLRRYADQLPGGFRACFKAPASVTASMTYDTASGSRAIPNPTFMSADRLVDELLAPCARSFSSHTGPILLEFPPSPRGVAVDPDRFAGQLDALLGALPREFEYAVEIRDRALLTPHYGRVLARHRAAHVYNYWSFMPLPEVQASVLAPDSAPFLVVRLLMRPGTRYDDQREAFRPFNRIVEQDDVMRAQVARLVQRIANRGRAFVLVNNKAEGSAPLTIRALAESIARTLRVSADS
jgi:uncharacterized protein YecE (DUF72 family)